MDNPVQTVPEKKTARQKWTSITLVHIYRYARQGATDVDICRLLGITQETFIQWKKKRAGVVEALQMARSRDGGEFTLADYCYERLPPELRELWDKIESWEKEPSGILKIQLMLSDHGRRVQQQLYLHALVSSHFSPSRALHRVGLSRKVLDSWIEKEPEFAELVEEIHWHKGNWFEESLVKLVAEGDTSATIFANKSWNKDRGYGTKTEVDVRVSGQITHGVVDLLELAEYLSVSAREELLGALRKREEEKELAKRLSATFEVPKSSEEILQGEIAGYSGEGE